jgi:MerR family transcriptional regulator, light-induced transcriptional regulator
MITQKYSIKDLEQITGIKAHTIRIWEKRFNLFIPSRTTTNIRLYSDEELRKLLNIMILNSQGIKISKLANLSSDELNEMVRNTMASNESDTIIESLIIDMIDFNQASFEKNLNRVIFTLGFEETVYRVIGPLYQKIGILWQTEAINPAQEHFITNLIKQKFFIAIDALAPPQPSAKTFLLFLRENEQHEISLLLAYYLIRKHGHKAIYLGQSVPQADVLKAWSVIRADYLVTHFTSLIGPAEMSAYLAELSAHTGNTPILVSGVQILTYTKTPTKNTILLRSPADLTKLLTK